MKRLLLSTILLTLVALIGQAQEIKPIADTYWRNEATGDWFIGFAPKHVIYDNKVWDIAALTVKVDTYMLTLDDGTVIKIGKLKKGKRTIAIGREKPVICSPITSAALPDYPIESEGRFSGLKILKRNMVYPEKVIPLHVLITKAIPSLCHFYSFILPTAKRCFAFWCEVFCAGLKG